MNTTELTKYTLAYI